MTRDDDRRLEDSLRGTLQAEQDGSIGEGSLDVGFSVQLAAYLDGTLDPAEAEAFEAHLAESPSARRLAAESARVLQGDTHPLIEPTRHAPEVDVPLVLPSSRPRRVWPLALAAGLAALVAGLWSSRPVESPSPGSVVAEAPVNPTTSGEDPIQRALQGHLEPVPAFASLLSPGQRPVLRTSATDLGPAPLSPRWTLVSTPRPVFVWRATWPDTSGEIYLVDANEALVAALPFEGSTTPVTRLPLPDNVPALESGRLYAWKVNVHYGEDITASDYVPFQVVDGEPPASATPRSIDDALEEAAELAVVGRFDDALAILADVDPIEHGRRAEPLLSAIFEQQQMFPKLDRLQRREMGWPDNPMIWPSPPGRSP